MGEGVGRVGRVEVDHVLAALFRREARDVLARIAVRDREKQKPAPARRSACIMLRSSPVLPVPVMPMR